MAVAPRTAAAPDAAAVRTPVGASGAPHAHALRELPVLSRLPVVALVALLVLSLLAPGVAAGAAVPVAVVGAVVGIPHGAVDHLVPWWWSGRRRPPRRTLVLLVVGYAATAAAAAAALLLVPTPALTVALVLSAVHFGRGEVVAWAERAGRPAPGPATDLLPGSAHALAVVGLLLWADPATTDPWLRPLTSAIADAALASRTAGLVLVAGAVTLALGWLLARRRTRDAVELGLVAAVFALAPPLAAFGAYFGLWHAVRHTGRLLDLARLAEPGPGWGPAVRRLARAGALPSAAALAAVATLWHLGDVAGLQAQVSVLLALTFPHAAVVWALDRRRRARV